MKYSEWTRLLCGGSQATFMRIVHGEGRKILDGRKEEIKLVTQCALLKEKLMYCTCL